MPKTPKTPSYRAREYGATSSHKVIFFFCPFSIPSWQLALPGLPIWYLARAGYHVIAYSYPLTIGTVSPQHTHATIRTVLADADNRINQLDTDTQISCYGTSMGTIFAARFASRHSRIRKVILNLCYSDIVDHMLALPPMFLFSARRLRDYIAAGGGPNGLHGLFDSYSPLYLVDQLADKQILLYLARNDRLHQYGHTQKLLQELRSNPAINLEYYENLYLGHYFAGFKNHLAAHRYMKFLRL